MDKKHKFLRAKTMIILVTLCLLFTACGGQGQDTDGGEKGTTGSGQGEQPDQIDNPEYLGMDQSAFEHHVDLSIISVRLTAGADLTLYLDVNGTILAAHCHNDEAIAVCGAAPVLGTEFGSALFAILNEMNAKAYLGDGSRLEVNIVEEEGAGPQFPLYDVIDEMFQKVLKDSGANIGMNMSSGIGSVGAVLQGGGNIGSDGQNPDDGQRPDDGQQPDQGGQQPDDSGQDTDNGGQPDDSQYLEVERDENGNLIRTVEEDSQGNRVERFYNSDGEGVKEIIDAVDGDHSVMEYQNGVPTIMTTTKPDGTEIVTTFHANGKVASETVKMPDGTVAETIMNEQGIRVSQRENHADGKVTECIYTEDGKDLSQMITYPDGTMDVLTWEYNDRGIVIRESQKMADGSSVEMSYSEAGVPTLKIEVIAGADQIETLYYENGNKRTETFLNVFGKTEVWYYTEDGKSATMTNSAGTTTKTFHPNGMVAVAAFTSSPSAGFDFTYEEYTYDENGTMLTHTKIQNNCIVGVSTYHYDRSHTTVFTYPGGGGHTEYWYGNNLLGGIDSNGNAWGVTVPGADYSGLDYSGTIGKG